MRKMLKIPLKRKKTTDYIFSQLRDGNLLSKTILSKVNFESGKFYVLLPSDAFIDKIYAFSLGGIIPSTPCGKDRYYVHCLNEEVIPKQVITTDKELSSFIFQFLSKNENHVAILEDVISKASDPYLKKISSDLILNGDEVYYLLNCHVTEADVRCKVRLATQAWHFVGLLSSYQFKCNTALEFFESLCEYCQYVIIGAYDGEGYLIWERN